MNDKELLEMAAKAAGIEYHSYYEDQFYGWGINIGEVDVPLWNPLTDDGDALRLAVTLGIVIDPFHGIVMVHDMDIGIDPNDIDATRRAIVRAAAEIGEAMP
jgi:hypothetical protein